MTPYSYIYIGQAITCFVLSGVLLLIWRAVEPKRHVFWWLLAFFSACIAWTMAAIPLSTYPSQDFFVISQSVLNLFIVIATPFGFALRAGMRFKASHLLILYIPLFIAVVWFALIEPHAGLHMGLTPLLGCSSLLFTCSIIYRHSEGLLSERVAIGTFIIIALANLAIALVGFSQGKLVDMDALLLFEKMNLIIMPAGYTTIGIVIILLITSDLSARMRNLAMTDPMTQLFNRRGLLEKVEKSLSKQARKKQTACLIVCDIDHFKAVNDTYGHDVGDEVIKIFAEVLNNGIRQADFVGRIGGEEFVILLPNTSLSDARYIAERIRITIAPQTYNIFDKELGFTASFGISCSNDYQYQYDELFKLADTALYAAKQGGRNQVQVAS